MGLMKKSVIPRFWLDKTRRKWLQKKQDLVRAAVEKAKKDGTLWG